MRLMTILGSPRRQGNTAKVLSWVEEHFRSDGWEVDRTDIVDCRVQGCGECMACQKGNVELCSIGDDANGLFPADGGSGPRPGGRPGVLLGLPPPSSRASWTGCSA